MPFVLGAVLRASLGDEGGIRTPQRAETPNMDDVVRTPRTDDGDDDGAIWKAPDETTDCRDFIAVNPQPQPHPREEMVLEPDNHNSTANAAENSDDDPSQHQCVICLRNFLREICDVEGLRQHVSHELNENVPVELVSELIAGDYVYAKDFNTELIREKFPDLSADFLRQLQKLLRQEHEKSLTQPGLFVWHVPDVGKPHVICCHKCLCHNAFGTGTITADPVTRPHRTVNSPHRMICTNFRSVVCPICRDGLKKCGRFYEEDQQYFWTHECTGDDIHSEVPLMNAPVFITDHSRKPTTQNSGSSSSAARELQARRIFGRGAVYTTDNLHSVSHSSEESRNNIVPSATAVCVGICSLSACAAALATLFFYGRNEEDDREQYLTALGCAGVSAVSAIMCGIRMRALSRSNNYERSGAEVAMPPYIGTGDNYYVGDSHRPVHPWERRIENSTVIDDQLRRVYIEAGFTPGARSEIWNDANPQQHLGRGYIGGEFTPGDGQVYMGEIYSDSISTGIQRHLPRTTRMQWATTPPERRFM